MSGSGRRAGFAVAFTAEAAAADVGEATALLCLRGFQFVQLQLQLLDLPFQLLRLAPELHPPQLGDQQFQMFDLVVARSSICSAAAYKDESFQFVGIE